MDNEVSITVKLRVYPSGEGTDLFLFDTTLRRDVRIGSFYELADGSFRCSGEYIPEPQICSCIDDAVDLVVTRYLNKPREEIEEGSPEEIQFYRSCYEAPHPKESGKVALLMFVLAALYAWWWLR